MIDLHSHTSASDGTFEPAQLIQQAADKKISVIAVTDHDTTAGLQEASTEAKKIGITFVPGIELNISWPTGEFHLLGLGLKNESSELSYLIQKLQEDRLTRNERIIKKMQDDGIDISIEKVKEMFPDASLGRPHIASYLVTNKICKTNQQAFDKFLGKGRKYHVERAGADLNSAIHAIKTSGGIPVIAHPLSLYLSYGKLPGVLKDIRNRGVEGLEAFHSCVRKTDALRLEEIAESLGMFITGGSDFHGDKNRKDIKLGYACNGEKIPDRLWFDELLPKIQTLHEWNS